MPKILIDVPEGMDPEEALESVTLALRAKNWDKYGPISDGPDYKMAESARIAGNTMMWRLANADALAAEKLLARADKRVAFLLSYFEIDDIGDTESCPGVTVDNEELEQQMSWGKLGPDGATYESHVSSYKDDLLNVLDKAIKSHGEDRKKLVERRKAES